MEITNVRQLTTSSGILIYPVIPLTFRFLNHPSSKLRRIGRPRTTLRGIYIILRLYTDSLHDSGIHPPIARPLALRSAFNRAPPSFGDSGGSSFDSVPERERTFGRSGAAPWLE